MWTGWVTPNMLPQMGLLEILLWLLRLVAGFLASLTEWMMFSASAVIIYTTTDADRPLVESFVQAKYHELSIAELIEELLLQN